QVKTIKAATRLNPKTSLIGASNRASPVFRTSSAIKIFPFAFDHAKNITQRQILCNDHSRNGTWVSSCLALHRGGGAFKFDPSRQLRHEGMKHSLDFEKPILELQRKLEELKKHPDTH